MIYQADEVRSRFAERRLAFVPGATLQGRIAEIFGAGQTIEAAVERVVREVAGEGDSALDRWSQVIDRLPVREVPKREWREAYEDLAPEVRDALEESRERIERFYRHEPRGGFFAPSPEGLLGQMVRPLARIGVYVPGGSAPLLSTALMTIVPARVAGVGEVIMVSPPEPHPALLAAAWVAGADRFFGIGGAQAIAALAYGTERVPRVDKIFGPGGVFVTLAKRAVFGQVGIDGLFGPTETVIIADREAQVFTLAADLLAQAEHDPLAQPWLFSPHWALLEAVEAELERQLLDLPRAEIARAALANGGMVHTDDLAQAVELANLYAPEHLCLAVRDPMAWLGLVQNAGGVFLGEASGEALGDYIAGPSHVMPTAGTARFGGGLSLRDYQKVIPVVGLEAGAAARLAEPGAALAELEGLQAHARALRQRMRAD